MKQFFNNIYGSKKAVMLIAVSLLIAFLLFVLLDNSVLILLIGMSIIVHLILYLLHILNDNRRRARRNFEQQEALSNILNVINLEAPLPPTRGWAASPDYLKLLLDEVLKKKPQTILECGSGVSTLIMAYGLKKIGRGKLISLDHDKVYYEKSKALISQHKLDEYIDLRYTPLEDRGEHHWYNIDTSTIENKIDLISVDGPPIIKNKLMRYPVLPILKDKLKTGMTLLLDDAHRNNEKKTVEKWMENFNVSYEVVDTEKGAVILNLNAL